MLKRLVPLSVRARIKHSVAATMTRYGRGVGDRILDDFRRGPVPTLDHVTTQLCSESQFTEPVFADRTRALHMPQAWHRKFWEHVYIVEAVNQAGVLREGARGLGFGCGRERLVSYFAALGCAVTATDAPVGESKWTTTGQHAAAKRDLHFPLICGVEEFDRRVNFRYVDMNLIPDDLEGFDFAWSCSSLEHLGSIEHGLEFIRRSARCLRVGGVAAHITEFNISSLDDTWEDTSLVFFRKKDIDRLIKQCAAEGIEVSPPNLRCVSTDGDLRVDRLPWQSDFHLKVYWQGYVATSLGILLRRTR